MRERFVRVLAGLALFGGLLDGFGCGSADATLGFGGGPGGTLDGSTSDVDLPPSDTGVPTTDAVDPDAFVPGKCGATAKADEGAVCIRVVKGAGVTAPHINEESRALGIDGIGALYVALLATETLDLSAKPIAYRTFPSASSSTAFAIDSDLPKTAEISVAPGTYYAVAMFYDQSPIGARDFAPGDYVPQITNPWYLTKVEVAAGGSTSIDLDLFPVRAVDIDVRLKGGLVPIGSGAGPLRARILTTGSTPTVVGAGSVPCADITVERPSIARILATGGAGDYSVRVALFDFAAGPDDPTLDLFDAAPPQGTLVNFGTSADAPISIGDGWISAKQLVELDRVVPFTTAVPADPTPSCVAYTSAPVK